MSGAVVARLARNCLICALYPEPRQEVNEAIWDGETRKANYRVSGARAYEHATDEAIDKKVVTRHADHIERSWRHASMNDPAAATEEAVFSADYESVVDRAAALGMQAMDHLEREMELGLVDAREMLGVAKMGVTARAQQRATEVDASKPQVIITAVMALASGHLRELPESEAIETYDPAPLLKTVKDERLRLEERARG